MTAYCPKCDKVIEFSVSLGEEKLNIRGEAITFSSEVAACAECSSKIFHRELDEKNLRAAYSVYRKKHNLLSPFQIANIRQKYGLSQRALARLLEWGEVTINRYETGAIQDPVHNEVLIFIDNPKDMKEIFEMNHHLLPQGTQDSLLKRIEELLYDKVKPTFRASLSDYISSNQKKDEYSGFAIFELEKMYNMILYITQKTRGMFTTKLNKILWYADFLFFKTYSKSISGSCYEHYQYGPVPKGYDFIIAAAIEDRLVERQEVQFESGTCGIFFTPRVSFDPKVFTEEEIKVIDFVLYSFKDYSCGAIKEKAHLEDGYKNTKDRESISYKFANTLSLSFNNG